MDNLRGLNYSGRTSQTESGRTCQRWDSQHPHPHGHGDLADQENYCRNVDNAEDRPWCFTTDANKEWEYCDVRTCSTCRFNVLMLCETRDSIRKPAN